MTDKEMLIRKTLKGEISLEAMNVLYKQFNITVTLHNGKFEIGKEE